MYSGSSQCSAVQCIVYSGSSQAINSFLTFYGWSIGWAPTLRFSQGFTRISPIVKDHSSAGFGKRKVSKIIAVESLSKKLGFTLRTWYKCANLLTAVHRLIWNLNRKNYLEFNCRKGGWVKLLVWGGDNLSEAGLARDMKGLVTWDTLPHFHTSTLPHCWHTLATWHTVPTTPDIAGKLTTNCKNGKIAT